MTYTVTAYAKLKGVTPETVRVWIHAGTLPNGDRAERSGARGRWRIIVV